MPCALVEKDGSFTQTQRMLQWHDRAVEPPGDARSDAWFVYHLGRRVKDLYKVPQKRDAQGPYLGLPDRGRARGAPHRERPQGDQRLLGRERLARGGFADLKDDGTTACGGWIYSGVYAGGVNQAAAASPGRSSPTPPPSGAGRGR